MILPRKMSPLIRIAIADLIKVEADPEYSVHMTDWHEPAEGVCSVCLAGSVMAKTLDAPIGEVLVPSSFGDNLDQLNALDYLRMGYVGMAWDILNDVPRPNGMTYTREITTYMDDPEEFKADMLALAEELEGL